MDVKGKFHGGFGAVESLLFTDCESHKSLPLSLPLPANLKMGAGVPEFSDRIFCQALQQFKDVPLLFKDQSFIFRHNSKGTQSGLVACFPLCISLVTPCSFALTIALWFQWKGFSPSLQQQHSLLQLLLTSSVASPTSLSPSDLGCSVLFRPSL